MKDKPFVVEEHLGRYVDAMSSIFEERCPVPAYCESRMTRDQYRRIVECWSREVGNIISPEIVPSVWKGEFVPGMKNVVDETDCEIIDDELDIDENGKSRCMIKIVLPCTVEVFLDVDDCGNAVIHDDDGNIVWDGKSSEDDLSYGLTLSNEIYKEMGR